MYVYTYMIMYAMEYAKKNFVENKNNLIFKLEDNLLK